MQKVSSLYAQVSAWALPVLIIILLLSLRECSSRGEKYSDALIDLDSMAKRATYFENEAGTQVAQNQQLQVDSDKRIKALTASFFNLKDKDAAKVKKVQDYTRINQEGTFKDKFAPFVKDSAQDVPDKHVGDIPKSVTDSDFVRVPQPFLYFDTTISISGRVTRAGVHIDVVSITNTIHLRTVVLKTGFLNLGRETQVQVLNTNPDIKITGLTSVTVKKKTSAWNRFIKPLIFAGVAAAVTERLTR